MKASDYVIGVNDEHGQNPPTVGKRTPVMPYLDRSIYENEFNRPAKIYFAIALLRCGFRILDIHPEITDIPISTRVSRANAGNLTYLVTFAYNAFGNGNTFNTASGLLTYYSRSSRRLSESRALAEELYSAIVENSLQDNGRGVSTLTDVGVLQSVNCPSALIEAGFMTNLREARLMLDPDWQKSIGFSACQGVANALSLPYFGEGNPSAYPVIRKGSRNAYVTIAQYYLILNGKNLAADGIFGSATQSAVIDFQRRNGLTQDGIIGKQTWTKLVLPAPSAYVLKTGSSGSAVRYAQKKLLSKLYPLDVDGIFGEQTDNAVKLFQTESGLTPDGIIGPLTWSVLTGLSSPRDR